MEPNRIAGVRGVKKAGVDNGFPTTGVDDTVLKRNEDVLERDEDVLKRDDED